MYAAPRSAPDDLTTFISSLAALPAGASPADLAETVLRAVSSLVGAEAAFLATYNYGPLAEPECNTTWCVRAAEGAVIPHEILRELPLGPMERFAGGLWLGAARSATDGQLALGFRTDRRLSSEVVAAISVGLDCLLHRLEAVALHWAAQESAGVSFGLVELRRALQMASRTNSPATILCLQIDTLAGLRVQNGPPAVEHYVQAVLKALRSTSRGTDTIIRLEDDTMVIILQATALSGGLHVAQNLLTALAQVRVEFDGSNLSSTVTFAMSPVELGELNPNTVLSRGLRALADARFEGGNRITEVRAAMTPAPN